MLELDCDKNVYTLLKDKEKVSYTDSLLLIAKVSCINTFLLLVSISIFVFFYCFILQPSFDAPTVENKTTLENHKNHSSFILSQAHNTLMYFKNGKHGSNVTEDMLKEEPYCNLSVHKGY